VNVISGVEKVEEPCLSTNRNRELVKDIRLINIRTVKEGTKKKGISDSEEQ
jgi:hypothetical protein